MLNEIPGARNREHFLLQALEKDSPLNNQMSKIQLVQIIFECNNDLFTRVFKSRSV